MQEIGSITHNQPKFLSCTWPQTSEGELNLPFKIGEKETVLTLTETNEGRNKSQAEESSARGISDTKRLFMIIRNI